jgi:hypothetical protein
VTQFWRRNAGEHGEIGRGRDDRVDIINSKTLGGTSAAYLAARLKRGHPEIWAAYMNEQCGG